MARQSVKLTSKRQATFPARLCEELGVGPGAELFLERCEMDGAPAWILRTARTEKTPWFGALRRFGSDRSHEMADIRRSIGTALGERRP